MLSSNFSFLIFLDQGQIDRSPKLASLMGDYRAVAMFMCLISYFDHIKILKHTWDNKKAQLKNTFYKT